MSKELVSIENYTPAVLFSADGDIDKLIEKIRERAESEVFDVSTPKGRKEIASMAAKVARSKTAIDNMGKDYVAELKALPKQVDAMRKHFRDEVDAIKEKVRRPLTDYEEAQKAREEKYTYHCNVCKALSTPGYGADLNDLLEMMAGLEALTVSGLAEEFQAPAATALQAAKDKLVPMIEQAKATAKAEAEQAEAARIAAEEAEKREAEEQARRDAEAKRLAEENAKLQAENAEAKAKQKAAEAEAARIAKQAADEKAELAKSEAMAKAHEEDQEHRRSVNNLAAETLFRDTSLSLVQAQAVIKAIALGTVPAVSIKY